ncbi:Syntaxin-51, partial [Bienertia sinuspersici]
MRGKLFDLVHTELDEGLEQLEETVIGTKHITLIVNEELDSHTRLINNLDKHVKFTGFHIL